MLKLLAGAALAIAWLSAAPAVASIHGGGTPFPATCPQGLAVADGCLAAHATSYAMDQIGGVVGPNGWPFDAQQTCSTYGCWNTSTGACVTGCQTWTAGTHPWAWNGAGIDYPVGNYTPLAQLVDPAIAATSAIANPGLGIVPGHYSYNPIGRVISSGTNQGSFPWLSGGTGAGPTLAGTVIQGFYFGPDQASYHTIGAQTTGTTTITAGSPDTISLTLKATTPVGYFAAGQNVYSGCSIGSGAPTGCTLQGVLGAQQSGVTGGTGVYAITGDTPGSYTGVTVSHDAVYVFQQGECTTSATATSISFNDNWFQVGSSTNQANSQQLKGQGSAAFACGNYAWNFFFNTVLGEAGTFRDQGLQEAIENAQSDGNSDVEYNYFRDHTGRLGDFNGDNAGGSLIWSHNLDWGCCEVPIVLHGEDFITFVNQNTVEFNTDVVTNTSLANTTVYYITSGASSTFVWPLTVVDHNIVVVNTGLMGAQNINMTVSGCPGACSLSITSLTGSLVSGNVIGCPGGTCTSGTIPASGLRLASFGGNGGTGTYTTNLGTTANGTYTGAAVIQASGTSVLLSSQSYINYGTVNISNNYIDTSGGVWPSNTALNSSCIGNIGAQTGNITGSQSGTTVTVTAIASGVLFAGPIAGSAGQNAYSGNSIGGGGLTTEFLTSSNKANPITSASLPATFTATVSQNVGSFTTAQSQTAAVGVGGAGVSFTMSGNKNLLNGNTIDGYNYRVGTVGQCN